VPLAQFFERFVVHAAIPCPRLCRRPADAGRSTMANTAFEGR
jgi:hypothetical protein